MCEIPYRLQIKGPGFNYGRMGAPNPVCQVVQMVTKSRRPTIVFLDHKAVIYGVSLDPNYSNSIMAIYTYICLYPGLLYAVFLARE